MKVELATVAATKLMMTGINNKTNKIKSCPGLFNKALINYYNRIDKLYNDIITKNEINNRKFKVWYNWQDGISIMIINKNFGVLYTGSVVYGFTINEEDKDVDTLHEMELKKYYIKGKNYIKRNPNIVFELELSRSNAKLRGVWSGFRSKYKEMSQKELWRHNLETIQRVRGYFGYCNEFVDGYSQAINEYLATL